MNGVRGELMGKIDCSVEEIFNLYLKLDKHKQQKFLTFIEKVCKGIKTSSCTKLVHLVQIETAGVNN